jgi:hypothetical protein
MKDFKFTEAERNAITNEATAIMQEEEHFLIPDFIERIEAIIQARADADGCADKDREIAELRIIDQYRLRLESELTDKKLEIDKLNDSLTVLIRRVAELEQTTPNLVLPSEEKKYTRFELERAHMAGWNNIDFEDWIKNLNPHITE